MKFIQITFRTSKFLGQDEYSVYPKKGQINAIQRKIAAYCQDRMESNKIYGERAFTIKIKIGGTSNNKR